MKNISLEQAEKIVDKMLAENEKNLLERFPLFDKSYANILARESGYLKAIVSCLLCGYENIDDIINKFKE